MHSMQNITNENPDDDTLGGRISRAPKRMRSEPRANRLMMLAGVLGVSPTWLLNGVGESPSAPVIHSEMHVLITQIAKLKRSHEAMGRMINTIESEAQRVANQLIS